MILDFTSIRSLGDVAAWYLVCLGSWWGSGGPGPATALQEKERERTRVEAVEGSFEPEPCIDRGSAASP